MLQRMLGGSALAKFNGGFPVSPTNREGTIKFVPTCSPCRHGETQPWFVPWHLRWRALSYRARIIVLRVYSHNART